MEAHLDLAEALLCDSQTEKSLAELQKADEIVKLDKHKLIVSYLRLLATKMLKQNTSKLEPKFAALMQKDIEVIWAFDIIENWLASGKVDAETKAFATDLTERLKAKQLKQNPQPASLTAPH